jgi:hypothetical protein
MRDRRFVAVHRGGPLDIATHRLLAAWAADAAEHVLPLFTAWSTDERPQVAIDTARAWARGDIPVGMAQKTAVAAHAAAREVNNTSATAAARAAGHAVATAHMADHSMGAYIYALKAVAAAGQSVETEREWQVAHMPEELRELIISGLGLRLNRRRS